jgi:hypothetical protein
MSLLVGLDILRLLKVFYRPIISDTIKPIWLGLIDIVLFRDME